MTAYQEAPPGTQRCERLLREIVSIRSVVGEDTTAHVWLSARLREAGMTVEHYAVEGRRTPLVLGIFEGHGTKPGVMFDAHYDTVGAVPGDWSHDPWGGHVEDGVLYGRGAVDSKGSLVAMLIAVADLLASGDQVQGPIYFMSDCDGEDSFRGSTLMADLGVIERVGAVFSAEATSNRAKPETKSLQSKSLQSRRLDGCLDTDLASVMSATPAGRPDISSCSALRPIKLETAVGRLLDGADCAASAAASPSTRVSASDAATEVRISATNR